MIRMLLREKTSYNLVEPRKTVTQSVKTCINKLVEEEISSGIQMEQHDFKVGVQQFAG